MRCLPPSPVPPTGPPHPVPPHGRAAPPPSAPSSPSAPGPRRGIHPLERPVPREPAGPRHHGQRNRGNQTNGGGKTRTEIRTNESYILSHQLILHSFQVQKRTNGIRSTLMRPSFPFSPHKNTFGRLFYPYFPEFLLALIHPLCPFSPIKVELVCFHLSANSFFLRTLSFSL